MAFSNCLPAWSSAGIEQTSSSTSSNKRASSPPFFLASIKGNDAPSPEGQQQARRRKARHRNRLFTPQASLSLLFLLSASVYWNSLGCDFVFDDVTAIKQNRDLRPHVHWSNVFSNDFWGTPMSQERSHKSYRPLTVLTFRWNYALSELQPAAYHLANVVLHSTVTVLYCVLCHKLSKSKMVAFTSAVLFAVHPVHTEAVTGVVGRAELLSSMWFLSALLSYIKSCKASTTRWKPLMLSLLFTVLATLSKEQGITVVAVCVAYEIVVVQGIRLSNLAAKMRTMQGSSFPQGFYRVAALGCFSVLLLLCRLRVMNGHLPSFTRFDNPAAASGSPTRHLTFSYLFSVNAWLLLNPCDLCCDWTMNTIPLVTSLGDPRNFATLLTLCAFLSLFWTSAQQKRGSVILMSLSLLTFPFLPASNIFFPVGFVVAERVLYLPSMGFCLLVSSGFHTLRTELFKRRGSIMQAAFCLCSVIYLSSHVAKTIFRNTEWRDEYSIFRAGLKVVSTNAKLFNNVGHALEGQEKFQEALGYFRQAALVQPDDVGAHSNVGRTLFHMNKHEEAEEAYLKAKALLPRATSGETFHTRVAPNHLHVLINLATLISQNDSRLEEADALYRQAISMRSDYTQAYINRGDLLVKLNRTLEAQQVYETALSFAGDNPDLLYNLGVVMLNQNKTVQALSYLDKALQVDPDHPQALLNSAILIQESGFSHLNGVALKRLHKIVESGQGNERIFFNLGMLSMDSGDLKAAEEWFKRSIEVRPDFRSALFNMALLLSEAGRPLDGEPYLRQLIDYYPDHVKGLILLGDLYINQLSDLEAAEACYRHILKLDPKNVQGLHNLCVVMVETGRLREAKECFEEAVELAPYEQYIKNHLEIVRQKLDVASSQ